MPIIIFNVLISTHLIRDDVLKKCNLMLRIFFGITNFSNLYLISNNVTKNLKLYFTLELYQSIFI